jgi:nucleoside-diphosphate-sugar epimerase
MGILITGAAGMIGRNLTDQLAKGGALHSRPIGKLTLADVVADCAPPGMAAMDEVVARDLASGGVAEKLVAEGSTRRVRAHLRAGRGIVRRDHRHSYRARTGWWIQ